MLQCAQTKSAVLPDIVFTRSQIYLLLIIFHWIIYWLCITKLDIYFTYLQWLVVSTSLLLFLLLLLAATITIASARLLLLLLLLHIVRIVPPLGISGDGLQLETMHLVQQYSNSKGFGWLSSYHGQNSEDAGKEIHVITATGRYWYEIIKMISLL